MKNNIILRVLLVIISLAFISSCDDDSTVSASLNLSQSALDIPYTGGGDAIILDCNLNWYCSVISTNINGKRTTNNPFTIDPSTGSAGRTYISIYSDENPFCYDVVQIVRFTAGETHQDLLITLQANPYGIDENGNSVNGGDQNGNGKISAPKNLRAQTDGKIIRLTWNEVTNALYYGIYYSAKTYGNYECLGYTDAYYGTSLDLEANGQGTYCFKVTAADEYEESGFSNSVTLTITGNEGGGNSGGGNNDGDGSGQKPAAPQYIYVDNYGSVSVPDVRVSWEDVYGATGYYVYRSNSASGSYSKIGSTKNTYYSDNTCKVGNIYYYKLKSYNNAGESAYSDYVKFDFKDTRKPGPVKYGNCTVNGSTMTLRWSFPNDPSYGKPDNALLRVMDPDSGEYITLKTLSGTTTSVSFQYLPWVDSDGYVKVGIILENKYGTGGGYAKVYDNKSGKWIN